MTEWTSWLVYAFIALAIVLAGAALYGWDVRKWFRAEYRAAKEETFAPGTAEDPRVQRLATKQKALARRMRRTGRSILSPSKAYEPALTKPQPAPVPPKAAQVYPIRKSA